MKSPSELNLLRAACDAARLLIVVVDAKGTVVRVNRAAARALERREADCLVPLWELAALDGEKQMLRAAFARTSPRLPSQLVLHLTGERRRIAEWSATSEPDLGDGITLLTGVDVTERLGANAGLRETEAHHRLMLQHLPAIVWTTDRDLRFTSSVGRGLESVNRGSGEASEASVYTYFRVDDDTHAVIDAHRHALEGRSASYEITFRGRAYQCTVEPLVSERGQIVGCVGVALDVTERAEAERARRESEQRLRRIVEANIIGMVLWSHDGRVLEANQAFLDLVGRRRDELLSGRVSWAEMTPPEYRERDCRAFEEICATGKCRPYEKEYEVRDGERVPVLVGAASLEDTIGVPPDRGVAFVLDLREQVRLRAARDRLLTLEREAHGQTEEANVRLLLVAEAGKALARSLDERETLQLLARLCIPALGDWSVVVRREGRRAAEEDSDREEEPGYVVGAHGDPERRALVARLCELPWSLDDAEGVGAVFGSGESIVVSDVTEERLGPEASVIGSRNPEVARLVRELGLRSMACVPIRGRDRVEAVAVIVATTDPRRHTRADLLHAEELASRAAAALENARLFSDALEAVRARDEFLAVAAHELRTPLTALMLRVQLLRSSLEKDEHVERAAVLRVVSVLEQQGRRLSRLVESLLEISRPSTPRAPRATEPVDLVQLVRDVLSTMAPELTKVGCAVRLDATADVRGVWERARIEQLVVNLLSNAMKFGRGRPIEVRVDLSDTRTARLSVRDHGIGISKSDQSRIFGRFERAVSARHFGGLGLGLYVSAKIVRAHGGQLDVQSEPGRGACFVVELPRSPS
jgi:PAS domain S-box-containing protein